ncbi:hypothetical protein K1T71_012037 [Dendrolimus kikuchii]|uniref:Uncharacterized protein n=1 Tax=Dendrolimus kikuchii TaxID=765133 RepID=A0ACC1CKE9_9NEOP|nr:hypothetical protein K1T71_012037 [Dendrolimus kikuchii]
MNKENNWSAAGSRRSAVAERIRIRQEWSALKGIDSLNILAPKKSTKVVVKKNFYYTHNDKRLNSSQSTTVKKKNPIGQQYQSPSEVLHGVVVLVDVGGEVRALPLRAALTALGATVVPKWSPLVTHLVWSQGGCRAIRAKARALATALVSPLWVEACAASNKRLPERSFPAASRASDLPSPRTLRQMLKKADMENLSLNLSDSEDESESKTIRLRYSSDTSKEKTTDTSKDTAQNKSDDNTETRINTAPRRRLDKTNKRPNKSRRKLWTQKENDLTERSDDDESDKDESRDPKTQKRTQLDKRILAQTKLLARKLLKDCTVNTQDTAKVFRIVLTGMNRPERHRVASAVRSLNGRIQRAVDKHTTHVLLGSCREETTDSDVQIVASTTFNPSDVVQCTGVQKARTLNALCGAARGCRVLTAQWALDSAMHKRWLHHHSYVVPHLKKIAQKACIERIAFGYQHTNYAYNVFQGMRVYVSPDTEQKDAALQLLKLCGASVQNGGQHQDGSDFQDGATQTAEFDVKVGIESGTVSSKWIFDSVASARMRTTKHYINV